MNDATIETRTVVVERELSYPPEKIWRALTQPHLIEDWLMKNDFAPVVGHRFGLKADWGAIECQIVTIDPYRTLSYRWDSLGLQSIVTWTLTRSDNGTHLRMDQSGFKPEQEQAYRGAKGGWPRFIGNLERTLATVE